MEENIEEEMAKMPKIDLTKVANAEALDPSDAKFLKNATRNKRASSRKEAKKKFNFLEPMMFPLPSRGKFYQDSEDEDLRKGFIKITPMTFAEEEILTNKALLKNGSMFRILFDTCIASDYDAKRILDYDVMYIMYIIRQISYGNDYHFDVTCEECNKKFGVDIAIEDIDWEELPDDIEEEFSIKLPVSKYTLKMRLERLGDQEEQDRLKKLNSDNELATDRIISMVTKTLSIKDTKGHEVDPEDWIDFYSCLPTLDKNAINDKYKGTVNTPKAVVRCPECGNNITIGVPIDEDFFRL